MGVTSNVGDVLEIGSEFILISGFTGSEPTYTITACTRGYAGSTAATYSNGASFSDVNYVHLNNTGYAYVAAQVSGWMAANVKW